MLDSDRAFVIAEIGVNHNGSIELAKKMIGAAKLAGADAVNFKRLRLIRLLAKAPQKSIIKKLLLAMIPVITI